MNPEKLLRELLFLPKSASNFADSIDHLHFFVISVTMLGSAAVFVVALWFMLRYRRTSEPGTTPRIQAPKRMEILVIGVLLGLFILWWVIGFMQYIAYATPPRDAEEIYVTGKQWMWKFAYKDGHATVGVLVVPVNRDIRLMMTSRDVIHSFYLPNFRIKHDVLPGRYTTAWFKARETGIFDVYCAEFCGTSHSRMWASVVVLPEEDYEDWLDGEEPELVAKASARPTLEGAEVSRVGEQRLSMAEQGRQAASENGCFACHTIDGQPHIGPTWAGLYEKPVKLTNGKTVVADEEYLTRSMMEPLDEVVAGYQPVMPTYLGSLKQPEAAAIVEFIKSLSHQRPNPRVRLPEANVSEASSRSALGATARRIRAAEPGSDAPASQPGSERVPKHEGEP